MGDCLHSSLHSPAGMQKLYCREAYPEGPGHCSFLRCTVYSGNQNQLGCGCQLRGCVPEITNGVNKEFFVTPALWFLIDQELIQPELNSAMCMYPSTILCVALELSPALEGTIPGAILVAHTLPTLAHPSQAPSSNQPTKQGDDLV